MDTRMDNTPQPSRSKEGKILGINLLILVGYYLLFAIIGHAQTGGSFVVTYIFACLIHAAVLLIMAFIKLVAGHRAESGSYFFTAIVLPIIGLGLCALGASTGGFLKIT